MKKLLLPSLLIMCATSFFVACKNDVASPESPTYGGFLRKVQNVGYIPGTVIARDSTTLYVLNEGNFNQATSKLSVIEFRKNNSGNDSVVLTTDAFQAKNGRPLGSLGNALAIRGSLMYIVMDGSAKIEIVQLPSLVSVGTIMFPSGSSPRQIVFAGNNGFVPALYKGKVYVVNLTTNTVTDSIAVGENPDDALAVGNNIFIANSGFGYGTTVSVIDAITKTVVSTLRVGDNPVSFAYNSRVNEVVVNCAGNLGTNYNSPDDDTPSWLFFVDGSSRAVKDSLKLGVAGEHPTYKTISLSASQQRIFVPMYPRDSSAVGRVASIDAGRHSVINPKYITGPAYGFYTSWMWEMRKELILIDAKNYVSDGDVLSYSLQ